MKTIKIEYVYTIVEKALVEVNGVQSWVSGKVYYMLKHLSESKK
jgi:hypothetical protein